MSSALVASARSGSCQCMLVLFVCLLNETTPQMRGRPSLPNVSEEREGSPTSILEKALGSDRACRESGA